LSSGCTIDEAIYSDYLSKGKASPDVIEALTRRIHDDSIDDALGRFIAKRGASKFVGFMGGSSTSRGDPWYRRTAETARLLTQNGSLIVTGGGPGMMEAANLGAYLSTHDESKLDDALQILTKAPTYQDKGWLHAAHEVKHKYPAGRESLGIPTWFYGFEPTNAFATHVAKYFDNSIREGGLIQIAKGGVVFTPGSAGARQEIFMDAAQNHYGTTGVFSAMAFLGTTQYSSVFSLLLAVANSNYADRLFISDSPEEIVTFLVDHPPKPAPKSARTIR
jgi:predicted Rossmann-fold nucleotide-binding protein